MPEYDAIVLAGGRSRRMNVPDKTRLAVEHMTLLDRTLAAAAGAHRIVVVGDRRPVTRDVTWTRETPVGAGPAAAALAGLEHISAAVVVLLAADLPLLRQEQVERLVAAVSADGAVYVDDGGHEQWLCSAWRTASLRRLSRLQVTSMRELLAPLEFARLADASVALDCDTPDDLARAEEMLK